MHFLKGRFTAEMAQALFDDKFKEDLSYMRAKLPGESEYERFRIGRNDDGMELVAGIDEHTEPNIKIKRDYAPAREYLKFMDNYEAGSMKPMPAIAPYRPIGLGQTSATQLTRKVEANVIIKLGLKLTDEQRDKYRDEVLVPKDGLNYNGYIESLSDLAPSSVGLLFNPFSLHGAKMVTSIKETNQNFFGTYSFMNKSFKFHWFKETNYYIVNSDVWTCYINCSFDLMKAFSIVSDCDFWRLGFKRKTHQPCALVGIVPVNDTLSPYDISNKLKRHDEKSSNYMRYGSSSLIRIIKKKYIRAVKLRTANFDPDIFGTWNFYEGKKKGISYVVKEEKILMNRKSSVNNTKFVSFSEMPGSSYSIFLVAGEEIAVKTNTRDFYATRIYHVADGFYFSIEKDDPPDNFEEFYNNPIFQRQASNYHGSLGAMSTIDFVYHVNKMPINDFIKLWLQELDVFTCEGFNDEVEPDDTGNPDYGEVYL